MAVTSCCLKFNCVDKIHANSLRRDLIQMESEIYRAMAFYNPKNEREKKNRRRKTGDSGHHTES